MAGPGVVQGVMSDALVGLQDILPTLATAVGTTPGQAVHGIDLSSHLADPGTRVREYFYSQTLESPWQSAMVTDRAWKYIYSEANATEELYDQENDPGELVNRIHDPAHADRAAHLRAQLRICAQELGDTRILDGDDFVATPVDREEIRSQPVGGMGWRYY